MTILAVILHIICLFGAVVLCKVAKTKGVIDDAEFPMIISIFLPLGAMVFIGALWVGELVSDNLS